MQFLKIVMEYTLTVHTATVADDVRKNFTQSAIKTVHFMYGFFCSLDK